MNKIALEKVPLKGMALSKSVFLDNEHLPPTEGKSFDWGYVNDNSERLSYTLLKNFIDEPTDLDVTEFTQVFTQNLPKTNFSVLLEVRKWLHWRNTKNGYLNKKRTALALMHIIYESTDYGSITFSKFLDLPNMDIKEAEFSKGTIEYKLLLDLCGGTITDRELTTSNSNLNALLDYYKTKTKRFDHTTADNSATAQLTYNMIRGTFVYSNGCLLYTSPSPRDQRGSRMPSSA